MNSSFLSFFRKVHAWRLKHISHKGFIYLISILVGVITGLAAVTIKNLTHYIQHFAQSGWIFAHGQYFFVYPIIGLLITFWVKKYIVRADISHGIPSTLFAISQKKSLMKRVQIYGSILTAPFTVGMGGSAGLEGPVVVTGSAIGSNLGKWFRLTAKDRTLFISCGAAGSIACIFNAPITSIVFALEIFSLDLTVSSLIPLLSSAVTANLISHLFLEGDYLFTVSVTSGFNLKETHVYLILGFISALGSIYFSKIYLWFHLFFDKIKKNYPKILIGGVGLCILILIVPPLYGEGYSTINAVLKGEANDILQKFYFADLLQKEYIVLLLLLGLILFKPIASSITFGAGGVGGIFAPTLFVGAVLGFLFAYGCNHYFDTELSLSNYSLVGMCGMISGVMLGPLTGIFMIAELTGSYQLFTPLMIVSVVSYSISKHFLKHSVYTIELAKKGQLLTHNKDKSVLSLLSLKEVIETNFKTVHYDMTLGELLKNVVQISNRNIFPVVNNEKKLMGIITLDDIRDIMFNHEMYDKIKVADILHNPPEVIFADRENMAQVIAKFNESGAWNLPVIQNNRYLGFVSKSKLFEAYRKTLLEVSLDD